MGRAIRRGRGSFLTALLKLIPSEVVAVYLFVLGVLPDQPVPHAVVAGVLVVLTPLYLRFAMGVRAAGQLAVSTVSMLIWVFALRQGPVQFLPWYQPWHGSVALAIWTLLPPMFLYRGGAGGAAPGVRVAGAAGKGGR